MPADAGGGRRQQVRTYKTFTAGLEALADWLAGHGVTHVVMEATGSYWKPCWYALEERGFELLLVNARHARFSSIAAATGHGGLNSYPLLWSEEGRSPVESMLVTVLDLVQCLVAIT